MKILFAAPMKGVQGGITRWTQHIINHYSEVADSENVSLELLDMGRSRFINTNMPIWKRVYRAFDDYSNILSEFRTKIKTTDYDILHLVSSASVSLIKDWVMLREAKKNGLKTILHFHFGRMPELSEKNNWEWKLIKMVLSLADRAVVLDKASYQTLRDKG